MCLQDPFGCACAAGFKGLDCNERKYNPLRQEKLFLSKLPDGFSQAYTMPDKQYQYKVVQTHFDLLLR